MTNVRRHTWAPRRPGQALTAGRAGAGVLMLLALLLSGCPLAARPTLPTVNQMDRAEVLRVLGPLKQTEEEVRQEIPVLRQVRVKSAADPAARLLVEHRLALNFTMLGEADSAFACLELAGRLSDKAGSVFPLEAAQALEKLSLACWQRQAFDQTEHYDLQAARLLEKSGMDLLGNDPLELADGQQVVPGLQLARLYTHAGLAPARRGQLARAIRHFDKGRSLYQAQHRLSGVLWAQELLGWAYDQQGQTAQATRAFEGAWQAARDLQKASPTQAPPLFVEVLRYWQEPLFQQGDLSRLNELVTDALAATDEALAQASAQGQAGPELLAASATLHLLEAEVLLAQGQRKEGQAALMQAERMLSRLDKASDDAQRLRLGYHEGRAQYLALKAGRSGGAGRLNRQLASIPDPAARANARMRVARALLRLKAAGPAVGLLDSAVALHQQTEDWLRLRDAYQLLGQAHASLNHYDKAYYYGERNRELTDSLRAVQHADALAEARARALQQARIQQAREEAAQARRNRLIGFGGTLLLLVAGIGLGVRYRRRLALWIDDVRNKRKGPTPLVNPVAADDIFFGVGAAVERIRPDGPRPRILVVEDNADLRTFLRHILTAHYTVLEADNGPKALNLLVRERVDLIAADEDLPGMSGASLLQHLKAQPAWRSVPFVLLTTHIDVVPQLAALEVGVDDYLPKPFLAREMLARVRTLLTNYRERLRFAAEAASAETVSAEMAGLLSEQPMEAALAAGPESVENLLRQLREAAEPLLANPEFGPAQLAARASVSEGTLHRTLKELTGLTPNGYLRTLRLEQARRLLERRVCRTVAEAAHAAGFNDAHHLGQNFFQHFGRKPSEYLR